MSGSFKIEMTINAPFEGIKRFSLTEEIDENDELAYIARRDNTRFTGYRDEDTPLEEAWQVAPEKAQNLIAKLERTVLSPCPPFVAGLDGTMVTLKITRGFNSAEFTWWEELPGRWENLRIISGLFDRYRTDDESPS